MHLTPIHHTQLAGRKFIVLDDDPTGTQTVSEVDIILTPTIALIREFFQDPSKQAVYILTNTRAMPRDQAIQLIRSVKRDVEQAANEAGMTFCFLLRGDSTLRGHVFAEMEAITDEDTVGLFVPAFPECGRVTLGGIHYLKDNGTVTPVADTEFAKDSVFGYTSKNLDNWVREVSDGWQARIVPLHKLRNQGASVIASALVEAEPMTVVIPDAETSEDLRLIADGLLQAEEQGANVVVRSASTFAAIRCGLNSKLLEKADLEGEGGLLLVCGSHTAAATRQLEQLTKQSGISPIIVSIDRVLADRACKFVSEISAEISAKLQNNRFAIVATERIRRSEHSDLKSGALAMRALTAIVKSVASLCSGVISKGGITSAQVAADGFNAKTAYVRGQLEAGISLWELQTSSGRVIPYCVVPGNVGDDQTLVHIVSKFKESIIGGDLK